MFKKQKEEVYEVEKIIGHRIYKNKKQYKILWVGYGSDDASWEDEENLDCPDILKQYNDELAENKKESSKESLKKNLIKSNPPVMITEFMDFGGIPHVRVQLKDSTYSTFLKDFILSQYPNLPKYQKKK